jgi:EipB-like
MALTRILAALALCAAPLLSASEAAADPAQAAPAPEPLPRLAPYRAVYDLTLSRTGGAKALASARGRISLDFSGSACGGYVESVHQVTELLPVDGPPRLAEMHTATFESADGKGFDFKIQSKHNNAPQANLYGRAKRGPGSALAVTIAQPVRQQVNLSDDAVFPAEHLRQVLAKARAGEKIYEVKVYDASQDGAKILDTTTLIGKATTTDVTEKAAQHPQLKAMKRWPVNISYFEPGVPDGSPLYVMSFELYENGVARALKLDYGDFALAGEMTELALTPTSAKCPK